MTEVEIDGVKRDLSHLQEFIITIAGKGKDGSDLRVAVTLSNHTVSTKCARGLHNMLDENGKPRQFCETRYAFSLGLRELAKRMLEQNYFCWESKDQNRSANYAIIDVAPGRIREVGNAEHQVVYFYLYPSKNTDSDVKWQSLAAIGEESFFHLVASMFSCFFEHASTTRKGCPNTPKASGLNQRPSKVCGCALPWCTGRKGAHVTATTLLQKPRYPSLHIDLLPHSLGCKLLRAAQ